MSDRISHDEDSAARVQERDGAWCSNAEFIGAAFMGLLMLAWFALAVFVAVTT